MPQTQLFPRPSKHAGGHAGLKMTDTLIYCEAKARPRTLLFITQTG